MKRTIKKRTNRKRTNRKHPIQRTKKVGGNKKDLQLFLKENSYILFTYFDYNKKLDEIIPLLKQLKGTVSAVEKQDVENKIKNIINAPSNKPMDELIKEMTPSNAESIKKGKDFIAMLENKLADHAPGLLRRPCA